MIISTGLSESCDKKGDMAYPKADKAGPSRRKVSEDVTSLDSWSEITADNSGTGGGNFQNQQSVNSESKNSELLLNPQNLEALINSPEPKVARVKLRKSSLGYGPDKRKSDTSKLLRIFSRDASDVDTFEVRGETILEQSEHFDNDLTSDMPVQLHEKYENHVNSVRMQDTEPKSLPLEHYSRSSKHLTNACNCTHCIENSESPQSLPVYASYDDSIVDARRSSQPFLKKHASTPFLPAAMFRRHHRNVENGENEHSERVKTKIMSMWNNVRYGWTLKSKTNFEKDSPIFLLGRCYHIRPEDEDPAPGERFVTPPQMELFKTDFQSRPWFTYRRDFQALAQTRFTTDCGWGCMLRSSQMMLAHAFICHFLGRDWRLHTQSKEQEPFYRLIIQWFGDSFSDLCPFSVHRLVEIGKAYGKQPGEWYGPSSVAYIVRDAISRASASQPVLKDLCVYVAQDCTVYKQDIIELCCQKARNLSSSVDTSKPALGKDNASQTECENSDSRDNGLEWKRSVIILIPVRLGGEEFNPIYSPCIKNLMAHECCLGLIGGKPKHSLYFIGWQEDKLIYLDPHFCQDYVDVLKRDFKISSFHCTSPRKMTLKKMDPSATVGFYCKTREDFDRFVGHMEEMVTPSRGSGLYPMFVFHEGKGSDLNISDLSLSEKSLRVRRVTLDEYGRIRTSTLDSEEFVVL